MMPKDDVQTFLGSLDRFGPELERWPAVQRAAATAMLASNAEAHRHLADAERARMLTRAAMLVEPPPHLASRILAHAAARQEIPGWRRWLATLVPRNPVALGAAAVIALLFSGVMIGIVNDTEPDEDAPAIVALLNPVDLGLDEEN